MSDREWNWQNATGCSTPSDANRLLLDQSELLRQKDKTIEALVEAVLYAERQIARLRAQGVLP